MAISPIVLKPKRKGGKGGGIGSIVGTVVGGVAGGIAGIPGGPPGIAAGATGGAAAGGALGGAAGGLIDPAKLEEKRGPSVLETAAKENPQVRLARLMEASEEIKRSTMFSQPQKDELLATFNPAIDIEKRNLA